jgi:hypothetical protein
MMAVITTNLGVTKSVGYSDLIFSDEDLPQNDRFSSDAFYPGRVQNALEVVVKVGATDFAITDSETVTIEYLYGDSYGSSETIYTLTASEATAVTAGTELARFVPPAGDSDYNSAAMLQITTTDASATGTVDAWVELVSR